MLKSFTELKCRLMPYIYRLAATAHQEGVPVLRSMLLEFPDDPAVNYLDRQYMLGDDLLVAPVFSADGTAEYYLPPGRWTHLLSGEVIEGPVWRRDTYGYDSLPLLVRPGSVMPIGNVSDRPDYDFADGVTLRVYELEHGASRSVTVPGLDGLPAARFAVARDGDTLTANLVEGSAPGWSVVLEGIHDVRSRDAERTDRGVRLRPDDDRVVADIS